MAELISSRPVVLSIKPPWIKKWAVSPTSVSGSEAGTQYSEYFPLMPFGASGASGSSGASGASGADPGASGSTGAGGDDTDPGASGPGASGSTGASGPSGLPEGEGLFAVPGLVLKLDEGGYLESAVEFWGEENDAPLSTAGIGILAAGPPGIDISMIGIPELTSDAGWVNCTTTEVERGTAYICSTIGGISTLSAVITQVNNSTGSFTCTATMEISSDAGTFTVGSATVTGGGNELEGPASGSGSITAPIQVKGIVKARVTFSSTGTGPIFNAYYTGGIMVVERKSSAWKEDE